MWVQKSYTTSWMISNQCDFTFLSFKLLESIFSSLTVKLDHRWHTAAWLYFQFDFDFHTTISLRAILDIQTQKFMFFSVFTHKQNVLSSIFIKPILARKFCIQTIKSQQQIAREMSNWINNLSRWFYDIGDFMDHRSSRSCLWKWDGWSMIEILH